MSSKNEIDPRLLLTWPRVDKAFIDILRLNAPAPMLGASAYKTPEAKLWDEARYDLFLLIERSTPIGWTLAEPPRREHTSASSNISTESMTPTSTSDEIIFKDTDDSVSQPWWKTLTRSVSSPLVAALVLSAAGIILGMTLSVLALSSFYTFTLTTAGVS